MHLFCIAWSLIYTGWGWGVLIIPPFRAETSKDPNLALTLGLPKGHPKDLFSGPLCPVPW